jgi:hypothetical protein
MAPVPSNRTLPTETSTNVSVLGPEEGPGNDSPTVALKLRLLRPASVTESKYEVPIAPESFHSPDLFDSQATSDGPTGQRPEPVEQEVARQKETPAFALALQERVKVPEPDPTAESGQTSV